MKTGSTIFLLVLCPVLMAGEVSPPQQVNFTTKPSAARDGDRVKISFAVSAPTDVEVAVLGADGKVVRHLAAGVLGGGLPPPEPLKAGLSQTLEWDGRDDLGKPAAGGPFKVRVRAGTAVKLGGFVGDPEVLESGIFGLATDDRGELFVTSGGGYGGNIFTVKVFDRDGRYLRTVFPYPASLKPADVEGFAKHAPRDGKLNPPQFSGLLPWIYPNALGALMGNRVQAGALWLTSGSGKICRIRAADGGCIAWNAGQAPAPPAQGPICWAASPDGRKLYLAGWYDTRRKVEDGQVFAVDPASGERKPFVKIDVPADNFWAKEKNGWYNFTNWGRKNGLSALHGLAVDGEGRVYVCDRVNGRLAVYDEAGKPLGSTAVEHPDLVSLSPNGPEIYVTTRRIIDGYKARNEVKVVKLSGWKDGKVLAELTLAGSNAPSMAVDATKLPAVIWLSNVGDQGGVTRIEDRGASFEVTGRLGEKARPMPGAVVKAWADPMSDNVILSDGWAGQSAYNGLTGEPQPWPLKGMELAFDRGGNYHVYGQKGWHELVTRFDRSFKPLAFAATGKNTTAMTSTGKDVYGRYGHGWCNKGLWIAPDGRIFVYNMYDWAKYFVNVWDASGQPEKHARPGDGLVGPLDSQGGTVCVDFRGSIYVGMHGWPKTAAGDRTDGAGSVVKFPPTGGGYTAAKGGNPGIEWKGGLMGFVEGGLAAYTGLAPQVGRGCVCKEARFEIDGWGRLYIPNALEYCVKIVDNAGNEIARFGYYGNQDSRGPESLVPQPEIALGWPIMVTTGQVEKGRLYVADTLNRRAVRVEVTYGVEETCEAK